MSFLIPACLCLRSGIRLFCLDRSQKFFVPLPASTICDLKEAGDAHGIRPQPFECCNVNMGKGEGYAIPSASPENSKDYEALQQAWENLEYTTDMKMLLDPLMEHKIELGACTNQVSPTHVVTRQRSV